ncbi:MAG TPA: hypothetical protein VE891_09710 [Allosphingosinicella sp.]|nr:hypothetical protein [Allosphingosinicella sp.]
MGCNARRTGTEPWSCGCCDARANYEYWACGAVTRKWVVWREPCGRCDDAPMTRPCPNR